MNVATDIHILLCGINYKQCFYLHNGGFILPLLSASVIQMRGKSFYADNRYILNRNIADKTLTGLMEEIR